MKERDIKNLSFKTNFFFNFTLQIITYAIPLVTAPYLSRVLLPSGIGMNSYVYSIVSYFVLMVTFGFVSYGTKEVAAHKNNRVEYSKDFWNILFNKLLLFVGVAFFYLLLSFLSSDKYKNLFLIYFMLVVGEVFNVTFFYQGIENYRFFSFLNILIRIVGTIGIFFFVKNVDDLFIYAFIFCGETLLVNLLAFFFALFYVNKPKFRFEGLIHRYKLALFYFLPSIALSLTAMIDKTMLGILSSDSDVGYYEEATKIINLVLGLINTFTPVLLSRMSNLFSLGDKIQIERKQIQTFEVYALLALPSFAGLCLIADEFIPLYFGNEFLPSIRILYILSFSILIRPIAYYLSASYYVPKNKAKNVTIFYFVGLLVNLIINYFLIINFQGSGAAIASLISDVIVTMLFVVFAWRNYPVRKSIISMFKPIIASSVMTVFLCIWKYFIAPKIVMDNVYKLALLICIGVLAYGVMLLILKEPLIYNFLNMRRKKYEQNSK